MIRIIYKGGGTPSNPPSFCECNRNPLCVRVRVRAWSLGLGESGCGGLRLAGFRMVKTYGVFVFHKNKR